MRAAAQRHGRSLAVVAVLALLAAACGSRVQAEPEAEPAVGALAPEPREVEVAEEETEPEPEPVGTAPLTGVEVFDQDAFEQLAARAPVAVKIPNNPEARPHTGLERADVVYEYETEGGVTRFAAIFHSSYPEVVGNVRSARFVDADLIAPYDGVMIYSGARGEVQGRINAAGLTTVTEGGAGFYRDGSRYAPHNLYTRLPQAAAARQAPPASPSPWRFDPAAPEGGREVTGRVEVPVSRTARTGWEYDPDAAVFRRFQNGVAHRVTGKGRIGAANVVVLEVPVTGRDSHAAPIYALQGSGAALLLRDGRAYDIAWSKAGTHADLELHDGDDAAVLAPGPTWVVLTYGGALERISGLG